MSSAPMLRLSQPKRQNPESSNDTPRKRLFLRPPVKKIPGGSSSLDVAKAYQDCSESNCFINRSTTSTGKATCPSLKNSSIAEPSGTRTYQASSHGSYLPPVLTPNFSPQAPALQPAISLKPTERSSQTFCDDRESSFYTSVCGVYSVEKASPEKVSNTSGRYHCPRCDTEFTRSYNVMKHFVTCITKYGNPSSLKWTDHPSLNGTAKFYARKGARAQEHDSSILVEDVDPTDALPGTLMPKPLSSIVEETIGSVEPIYKPIGRDAIQKKNVVRPIQKGRDAFRCSKYNPETIGRDVLLATGGHPSMDPLNAHLKILQNRFRAVHADSNLSTFRWDLVDPQQNFEKEPEFERKPEQKEAEPRNSASKTCEAKKIRPKIKDVRLCYNLPVSLPSRPSMKPGVLDSKIPFRVISPDKSHFGPMSTMLLTVFNRDSSATLVSSNEDLWAAIFTMLEYTYHGPKTTIRLAISTTSDVLGWVACHEVNPLEAAPQHPTAYLDWITAAQLLPSQISRFTSVDGSAMEKAERSNQSQVFASRIQAQVIAAQKHLVPVRRVVINALVVHPLHQGRGVGSALLKSITEIMDIDKAPVWGQAPEDPAVAQGVPKVGLFRRAGFMCAGELNLKLERDKRTGGVRSFKQNFWLRWPRPVGQKPSY